MGYELIGGLWTPTAAVGRSDCHSEELFKHTHTHIGSPAHSTGLSVGLATVRSWVRSPERACLEAGGASRASRASFLGKSPNRVGRGGRLTYNTRGNMAMTGSSNSCRGAGPAEATEPPPHFRGGPGAASQVLAQVHIALVEG